MKSTRKAWIGAGIAIVVIAALVLSHRSEDRPVAPGVGGAGASPAFRPADTSVSDRRIEQLERRLAEMEARAASAVRQEVPVSDPAAPAMTTEQRKELHRAEHRRALEDHARESLDPAWARATTVALTTALRPIAARSEAAVVSVDCRSATCVADLEWPNLPTAARGWRPVLEGDYDRCSVRVTLDDAVDPKQRFRTRVLFTCPHEDAT
jgi:hypothetical protein